MLASYLTPNGVKNPLPNPPAGFKEKPPGNRAGVRQTLPMFRFLSSQNRVLDKKKTLLDYRMVIRMSISQSNFFKGGCASERRLSRFKSAKPGGIAQTDVGGQQMRGPQRKCGGQMDAVQGSQGQPRFFARHAAVCEKGGQRRAPQVRSTLPCAHAVSPSCDHRSLLR